MDITSKFYSYFHHAPKILVKAPGRVNLLGEHVDYNQGPVLPAAIDRAVYLAARPNDLDGDQRQVIDLYAIDLDQQVTFNLNHLAAKVDIHGKPLPAWACYSAGVAYILQKAGYQVTGAQIAFSSDIPIGAGLSSSAAVEVAFAVLWQATGNWQVDRLELAQLCQKAESEYVGVSCGLMDQFASACGVEGHALFFDTRSLTWKTAPLPNGTVLVIADSGIRRSLIDSGYNQRRASCEQAVKILKEYMPEIQSLRDVKTTEFAAFSPYLPDIIRQRAEHVIKEIQRVHSAYNALLRQDKQAIGALMYAGHRSLRDLYEVSTPELDLLVDLSRHLPGGIGARLTGAGFGGCTINLVEDGQAEQYMQELASQYYRACGKQAKIFKTCASQGAYHKFI